MKCSMATRLCGCRKFYRTPLLSQHVPDHTCTAMAGEPGVWPSPFSGPGTIFLLSLPASFYFFLSTYDLGLNVSKLPSNVRHRTWQVRINIHFSRLRECDSTLCWLIFTFHVPTASHRCRMKQHLSTCYIRMQIEYAFS